MTMSGFSKEDHTKFDIQIEEHSYCGTALCGICYAKSNSEIQKHIDDKNKEA